MVLAFDPQAMLVYAQRYLHWLQVELKPCVVSPAWLQACSEQAIHVQVRNGHARVRTSGQACLVAASTPCHLAQYTTTI